MNLKKFISGVSALAIAASAFAGLAVTASAATLYSQDYESGTVDWTTGTGGRFTPVILEEDGNKYLSVDQDTRNNNGTTISSTAVSIDADTDYTMSFDFKVSSSTNQSPVEFNVYNKAGSAKVFSLVATGTWATTWTVNGGESITLPNTNKGSSSNTISDVPWYTAIITSSGDKEYVTIKDKANETIILDKKGVVGSAGNGIGKFEFITKRYLANFAIDNVLVRDIEDGDLPSIPQGSFKVQYVTTDNVTLEKAAGGSADAGTNPSLTAADKADFTENGQKYIYVSDNADEVTIVADDEVTVTVTVRAAAQYNVTVNANVDGTASQLTALSVFEGDSASYSYPKYLTDSNKKVTAETSETNFTRSVAPTEDTTVAIDYSAYTGTAYFVDHETITNTSALASGNYSNGSASRAVNDGVAAFTVAEAGTYSISVAASCRNTSNSSVFAVYKNEVSEANLIFNDDVKGTSQNNVQSNVKTKTDVELEAGDVIIIQGDNGNTWVDYVLAVRVPITEVDGTVDVAKTFSGDNYEGVATALTATFDITGATVNNVTVTPDGDQVTGDAQSQAIPATSETTLVYGIVVNKIVDENAFTAKATFVE